MRAFWTFADTGNAEGMMGNGPCYLALPDGRFLHEKSYAGYGLFDGFDVFELTVWWNRKYLAEHPEHVILNLELAKFGIALGVGQMAFRGKGISRTVGGIQPLRTCLLMRLAFSTVWMN